jgi:hypothetical protein
MSKWDVIFTLGCIAGATWNAWFSFSHHQPGPAFTGIALFAMVITGNLLLSRRRK